VNDPRSNAAGRTRKRLDPNFKKIKSEDLTRGNTFFQTLSLGEVITRKYFSQPPNFFSAFSEALGWRGIMVA